jgi:hypothetical protein
MTMTQNLTLTRTKPAPQVASLERWLALGRSYGCQVAAAAAMCGSGWVSAVKTSRAM